MSCAYLRPVKRIDLLCDALIILGNMKPDWNITWNHFGGGDSGETDFITKKIKKLPSNVKANLWGNVSNSVIIEFYKKTSVDFLISVSSSEGIPVSMMEALSFGIPIIATDVGGARELVTNENGLLLQKNITVDEIAKSINEFISHKDHVSKRNAARKTWFEKFNSDKNFSAFCSRLLEILDRKYA